jgi:hypothetical protein
MLEPNSFDRVAAEVLLHNVISIQSFTPDLLYEMFCADCDPRKQCKGIMAESVLGFDMSNQEHQSIDKSGFRETEKPQDIRAVSPFPSLTSRRPLSPQAATR